MTQIYFYSTKEAYGEFSNFAIFPIQLDGKIWPSSEHYFQAQKFLDTDIQEKIRNLPSPMQAANFGRRHDFPLRPDWERVKDHIMFRAALAKFRQHPQLKNLLLDTGQQTIIEHTENDAYWADGGDGTGRNQLGWTLMLVREWLAREEIFHDLVDQKPLLKYHNHAVKVILTNGASYEGMGYFEDKADNDTNLDLLMLNQGKGLYRGFYEDEIASIQLLA